MSRSYSSWGSLPDEVVAALCANLDASADFAAARLACKPWASSVPRAVETLSVEGAVPDGILSRNLSALRFLTWNSGPAPPGSMDRDLHRFDVSPLAALKSLKSLSIVVDDDIRRTFVLRVPMQEIVVGLETLTNVTSLSLHIENMRILPRAVFQLTQLESLALPGCRCVLSLKELERLPRLTALDLTETMVLQDTIPESIRSLKFHNTPVEEYGVKIHDFADGLAASLTSLVITESQVFDQNGGNSGRPYTSDRDFQLLATMTSLETLVMRDCVGFGREHVPSLANLRRLRTLDLSGTSDSDYYTLLF